MARHYFFDRNFNIVYTCDKCGRFVSPGGNGVSWSVTWEYSFDGTPDLNDPVYRCSSCTDKHGIRATNCAQPHLYQGRGTIA